MHTRKNTVWCIIIALLIVVAGMYFEDGKVDSISSCAFSEEPNCYISESDSVITKEDVDITRTLGVREYVEASLRTNGLTNQSRAMKVSLFYKDINVFSSNEGKYYASLEEVQLIFDRGDEFAINYIHKSDGKKRI